MTAAGIHSHPTFKLGLAMHGKPASELLTARWRTGVPPFEPAADRIAAIRMSMDGNDQHGDCGPVSVDHHGRVSTLILDGAEVDATLTQVYDLYRRSGNPTFDPASGAGDGGVDMATMLAAVRGGGLGGRKVVAYARLSDTSDPSVYAAIDVFGAVLFAVGLQVAQQGQSDQPAPVWDHVPSSGDWGGHAVCAGAYDAAAGRVDVVSWGKRIGTTPTFRAYQLAEVWVPIWPELLGAARFVAAVDTAALAVDYQTLTGQTLPVAPAPPAPPAPVPAPPVPDPTPVPPPAEGEVLEVALTADLAAQVRQYAIEAGLPPGDWIAAQINYDLGGFGQGSDAAAGPDLSSAQPDRRGE